MNILAFDTCFDACSAAAGRGLRSLTPSIGLAFEPMAVGHAERLMPMIEGVMAEAGLSFAKLDRIAVTHGPGTFTGTRIAVAAARALSLATGAPIVAVSSLRLMAMSPSLAAGRGKTIAMATDARRGECYVQLIDRHTLNAVMPPRLVHGENAADVLGRGPIAVAGSGALAIVEHARRAGCDAVCLSSDLLPDAVDMLFAAMEEPLTTSVEPLYLRAPDAKPPQADRFIRFRAGAGP